MQTISIGNLLDNNFNKAEWTVEKTDKGEVLVVFTGYFKDNIRNYYKKNYINQHLNLLPKPQRVSDIYEYYNQVLSERNPDLGIEINKYFDCIISINNSIQGNMRRIYDRYHPIFEKYSFYSGFSENDIKIINSALEALDLNEKIGNADIITKRDALWGALVNLNNEIASFDSYSMDKLSESDLIACRQKEVFDNLFDYINDNILNTEEPFVANFSIHANGREFSLKSFGSSSMFYSIPLKDFLGIIQNFS